MKFRFLIKIIVAFFIVISSTANNQNLNQAQFLERSFSEVVEVNLYIVISDISIDVQKQYFIDCSNFPSDLMSNQNLAINYKVENRSRETSPEFSINLKHKQGSIISANNQESIYGTTTGVRVPPIDPGDRASIEGIFFPGEHYSFEEGEHEVEFILEENTQGNHYILGNKSVSFDVKNENNGVLISKPFNSIVYFNIESFKDFTNITLNIYDYSGYLLDTKVFKKYSNNTIFFNTEEFLPGFYVYELVSKNRKIKGRLLKN